MKKILFQDTEANQSSYCVFVPDSASRWTLGELLDYIKKTSNTTNKRVLTGSLLARFRFENFKLLLADSAKTLNEELTFFQNDKELADSDRLDWQNKIVIEIGRIKNPEVDLSKLNLRERNKKAFSNCRKSVSKIIDELFDFKKHVIRNKQSQQVKSFMQIVDDFTETLNKKNQLRFIFRIAQLIYESPFENIGRVVDNIPFHSGMEMWARIYNGMGGVCAEKASALKFICDIVSIETRPVFASRSRMYNDIDSRFVDYLKCGGNAEMPVQVQHLLLKIIIGRTSFLVDVTNGNMPFLFLQGKDISPRFKAPMRLRMVYHIDRFHLKEVSELVGDGILTVSEFHIKDLYYQYVFKQQLGLSISNNIYLGVFFDWGGERSEQMQTFYAANAKKLRYPYPLFIHEDNVDSLTDENTKKIIKELDKSLRSIYKYKHYTGGFTFVIQPLHQFRWNDWQISNGVKAMVNDFPAFQTGE